MISSSSFFCLPPELRRQIWIYLLPPPIIQIPHIDTNPNTGELYDDRTPGAPHPVLLRICRESRFLALEHYTFAFGSSYVDFDLDTVYYMYHCFAGGYADVTDFQLMKAHTPKLHRRMIKQMAIDSRMLLDVTRMPFGSRWERIMERILRVELRKYPNLETLTVIIRMPESFGGPGSDYDGDMILVEDPTWKPWDPHGNLHNFLSGDEWKGCFPDSWPTAEGFDENFELETGYSEAEVRHLREQYPEKRFPDINWCFLVYKDEYL